MSFKQSFILNPGNNAILFTVLRSKRFTTLNPTILYIDNNKNSQRIVSYFNELYHFILTSSNKEALDIIKDTPVNIFIYNIDLFQRDGHHLLKSAEYFSPGLVKLLITEQGKTKEAWRMMEEYNFYQVIFTPLDIMRLKTELKNAVKSYKLLHQNDNLLKELAITNQVMEEKIASRTNELKKKNEELKEANKLKDKLFSIISHDLMTPLYSFNIFIDVILKKSNNISIEKVRNYCFSIKGYVEKVKEMLENLLQWSSSQINQTSMMRKEIDLKSIIEENYRLFNIIAKQKKISIRLGNIPENLMVNGDANMINIILRNLISNAIKFTSSYGQIFIYHTIQDDHIVISISDNGIGIDERELSNLFYINKNKPSSENGFGIGLKLCKEFVEKLDGKIWVQSEKGVGSTFSFSLPLLVTV